MATGISSYLIETAKALRGTVRDDVQRGLQTKNRIECLQDNVQSRYEENANQIDVVEGFGRASVFDQMEPAVAHHIERHAQQSHEDLICFISTHPNIKATNCFIFVGILSSSKLLFLPVIRCWCQLTKPLWCKTGGACPSEGHT